MALASLKGAIGGDGGDLLLERDLGQRLGQHRCIARVAGGELGRPEFQGFFVELIWILDLSRICAAPSARLSHLAFEGQGAFASQC